MKEFISNNLPLAKDITGNFSSKDETIFASFETKVILKKSISSNRVLLKLNSYKI